MIATIPDSAVVIRRDIEEVRIECDIDDQQWIKDEGARLAQEGWQWVTHFCPKVGPMQYSRRVVMIAVREVSVG